MMENNDFNNIELVCTIMEKSNKTFLDLLEKCNIHTIDKVVEYLKKNNLDVTENLIRNIRDKFVQVIINGDNDLKEKNYVVNNETYTEEQFNCYAPNINL
jgi:hypothetical protein